MGWPSGVVPTLLKRSARDVHRVGEAGGEIAGDLFQLYEFARFHVLKAWRGDEGARLSEAALAIGDILQAWQEIGAQVKPPSA